jgi:hypothetical protein
MKPKAWKAGFLMLAATLVCPSFAKEDISQTHFVLADKAVLVRADALTSQLSKAGALDRNNRDAGEFLSGVSDTIEELVAQGSTERAKSLASAKRNAVLREFGPNSTAMLDSLHDEMFIATQLHDDAQFKSLMSQFAQITATMRSANREDEIVAAERQRTRRLQAKIDSSLTILFQPLAK